MIKILIIIFACFALMKFIFMLVVLVLKLSLLQKEENEQMSFLKKVTFLDWGSEYGEWYIVPTIVIAFNGGFSIDYHWLKIHYSHFWKIVTIEEENLYANYLVNKNKQK